MADIRDQGFGLNYNRGFGSKGYIPGASTAPIFAAQQGAADALNQRRLSQQQFGQNKALQGEQLAQRQREAEMDYNARMAGYSNQTGIANIQAEASKYPHVLRQTRWNQVWPWAQNVLKDGTATSGYQGGGQVGNQPTISDAPVYSEQQIQQQVNAARAQNDAATASRNQKIGREMAGRGYGSRSPLAMALANANQSQALGANTAAEQQLRFQAAGANASHVLDAQKALEQQFASRQGEDIERNKQYKSFLSQTLASILGSI
jgi:hypothetical protein